MRILFVYGHPKPKHAFYNLYVYIKCSLIAGKATAHHSYSSALYSPSTKNAFFASLSLQCILCDVFFLYVRTLDSSCYHTIYITLLSIVLYRSYYIVSIAWVGVGI